MEVVAPRRPHVVDVDDAEGYCSVVEHIEDHGVERHHGMGGDIADCRGNQFTGVGDDLASIGRGISRGV